MRLLVSFCNTGVSDSRYALGLFRFSGGRLSFEGHVDLGAIHARLGFSGITGLCVADGAIHAGLQRVPSALATFDPARGTVEAVELGKVLKIHSMVAADDRLLLASTGTNSVVAYDPATGAEAVLHALDDPSFDTLHLNGLALMDGRLLACMFGPVVPGDERRFGEVRDLDTGRVVIDRLHTPHSVMAFGGDSYVLESGSGQLVRTTPGGQHSLVAHFFGWVRGLCFTEAAIFVGRSGFRAESASHAKDRRRHLGLATRAGAERERAAIYALLPDGGEVAFDVSDIGSEIYDIVAVEETTALPLLPAEQTALARAIRRRDGAALARLAATLPPLLAAEARLSMARIAGDRPAALAAAGEGVALAPDDPHWQLRMAEAAVGARRMRLALRHTERAAECAPRDLGVQMLLATRARRCGELALAEAAALRALSLEPRGATIYYQLAMIREARGDIAGAGEAARRSLAIMPTPENEARLARYLPPRQPMIAGATVVAEATLRQPPTQPAPSRPASAPESPCQP